MNAPEPAAAVLHSVPTGRILKSPTNPRKRRNAAADAELAESVKAHGILQPLLVRAWAPGMALPKGRCFGDMIDHYELIAGERRWTAAQAAGLAEVPVLVRDLPDDAVLELQLVENIQREDLHPLEEAEASAACRRSALTDGLGGRGENDGQDVWRSAEAPRARDIRQLLRQRVRARHIRGAA